jgi:hypothetical protein
MSQGAGTIPGVAVKNVTKRARWRPDPQAVRL